MAVVTTLAATELLVVLPGLATAVPPEPIVLLRLATVVLLPLPIVPLRLAIVVPPRAVPLLPPTVLLRPVPLLAVLPLLPTVLLPPVTVARALATVVPLLLVVVPPPLAAVHDLAVAAPARPLRAVSLSGSTRHRLPATPRTAVLRSDAWASVTARVTRKLCVPSSML